MIDRARLWPCVFGALTAVGLVAAFVSMPFAATVAIFIGFALAGPMFYGAYRAEYKPGTRKALPQPTLRQLVRGGAMGGAAAVATAGYVAMTGPIGLLVPVVALAALPIGPFRPASVPEFDFERLDHPSVEPIAVSVGTPTRLAHVPTSAGSWPLLGDADLCRAWRTSFTALQDCHGHDRTPLIETRRQLLDELARRDPAGFSRWLDAGARAASNPHPFLTSTRSSPRSPSELPTDHPDDAGDQL